MSTSQEALAGETVGDGQSRRVVGERHVLVTQSARGAGHHVDLGATIAPQRVHVEVALELGDELITFPDGEGSLRLELVEIRRGAGGGDLGDERSGLRADAVQLLERAGGHASAKLICREDFHDLRRSQVCANAIGLLPNSVK